MSLIQVRDVSHWYAQTQGSPPALRDLSLAISTNEVVAVIGESGCGKTTLGKLVAGLFRPTFGQITFEGELIWSLKGGQRQRYRRSVQFVHQDPYASLNPGVTIWGTLAPALVRNGICRRRDVGAVVAEALSAAGLDASSQFLERYPHELSGGQRQRVAVARAVSLQPSLIIADEATSMLDVSVRVAVLDLLLSIRKERELAYLFISHDFGVVRYFARGGRILVMLSGVVIEEAPTEDLIANPFHPYTVLLLQSVPVPDPEVNEERRRERLPLVLESTVPLRGCVFSRRCPFAKDICRSTTPPQTEVATGHVVRCWFPGVAYAEGASSPETLTTPEASSSLSHASRVDTSR